MYAVMATIHSSLAVTKNYLPQMAEHCEIVTGTLMILSPYNLPELVVSSYSIPVHLEWIDNLMLPIQQTTFTIGELVIGSCSIL